MFIETNEPKIATAQFENRTGEEKFNLSVISSLASRAAEA
jgi:hypothetical protein